MYFISDDIALWRQFGIKYIPIENSKQKTLVMDDSRKDGRVIEIDAGTVGDTCMFKFLFIFMVEGLPPPPH